MGVRSQLEGGGFFDDVRHADPRPALGLRDVLEVLEHFEPADRDELVHRLEFGRLLVDRRTQGCDGRVLDPVARFCPAFRVVPLRVVDKEAVHVLALREGLVGLVAEHVVAARRPVDDRVDELVGFDEVLIREGVAARGDDDDRLRALLDAPGIDKIEPLPEGVQALLP